MVLYKDRAGEYRWTYTAQNGNVLAVASEGYRRRIDAERGAKRVTGHRLRRRVKFVTGPGEGA